jgi:hypothetical protein
MPRPSPMSRRLTGIWAAAPSRMRSYGSCPAWL